MSLGLLAGVGCSTVSLDDERANLVIAQKTYVATVRSLTKAYDAGFIEEDLVEHISNLVNSVDANLLLWEEALLRGDTAPELADLIKTNLALLSEFLIEDK